MELERIEDQVVVVVGASSGIGRLAARAFAQRGARVVVAARDEEGLRSLADEIRDDRGEVAVVPADAVSFEDMERVAHTAADVFGGIDTWLQTAAVSLYARFEDTEPEEFRRVIEVDLLGQAHGAMAALPWLRRTGRGALIQVSSIEALRALPYQSAYGAAKHGMIGMSEALRLELMEEGVPIAVTNVMPSSVDTPLFDKARTKLGVKPRGVPPVYAPRTVVRAILHAAEHPTRDLVVGGGGRALVFAQALSPKLVDALLLRYGFPAQRTESWRSARHPDNLDDPVRDYDRVRGTAHSGARERSLYTDARVGGWAPPVLTTAFVGAAVALLLALRARD